MTELERQLLSALERLENDYETRERALHDALVNTQRALNARFEAQSKSLHQRLDDTTKRLELMTKAYTGLLTHIDDLSSQLAELQNLLVS